MAQLDDIADALRNAHAAGDTAAAQKLADAYVAAQQASQPPAAPPESEGARRGRTAIEALNQKAVSWLPGVGDVVTAAATGLNAATFGIPERLTGDTLSGMRAAAPTAAAVGEVGGVLTGGAGVAKTLTNVAPRLAIRAGERVATTGAKLAAQGAAAGTIQAEASGEDIGTGGVTGAAGGLVGGAAANLTGKAAVMLKNRGIHALGKLMGEDPADIAQAMANFETQNGRKATMLDVANLRARGALKQYAARNPEFGAGMAEVEAGRAEQLPKSQTPGVPGAVTQQPTDIVTLHANRDTAMNTAMGDTADPNALRNKPVTSGFSKPTVLFSPKVMKALRGDPELQEHVSELLTEPTHEPLTVDHFENLRQSLRKAQNSETNSIRANKIKTIADEVEAYAGQKQPAYKAALDQYRKDSNYADAFAHARSGGDRTTVTDPKLRAVLKTQEGDEGFKVGAAEKTAADNYSAATPSFIKPEAGMSTSEAAHLAIATAKLGSPWAWYHLSRAVPGLHVPKEAQKQLVNMLTSANSAPQALRLMSRYGAKKADIDTLSQALAAASGKEASQVANQPSPGQ